MKLRSREVHATNKVITVSQLVRVTLTSMFSLDDAFSLAPINRGERYHLAPN